MSLITDITSIEDFVKSAFPSAATYKQDVPRKPAPNTFVIRFLSDSRELETTKTYRIDREYQVIYIGTDAPDVLTQMDSLSKALYQTKLIPLNDDSLRYIRVESFSISQPFREETADLYACIGVLSTEIREARDQATYDKIMHVYSRITLEI